MKRTTYLLTLALVIAWPAPGAYLLAQSGADTGTGFIQPIGDMPERDPLPRFVLRPRHQIPLPGPLAGTGPVLEDGRVRIAVAGGTASTAWSEGATPAVQPDPGDEGAGEAETWVESPGGKRRYRTLPEGRLVAQKPCKRCRDGWRTIWTLRVPGGTVSPPVVTTDRIFFGALDNRVYSLKRRNGHRRWVASVEGRISDTPLYVELEETDPRVGDALVVVPGGSGAILLGTRRGDTLGRLELDNPDDRFVGAPVLAPDGSIVFACQRYREEDAALLVYALERAAGAGAQPATAVSAPPEAPRRP